MAVGRLLAVGAARTGVKVAARGEPAPPAPGGVTARRALPGGLSVGLASDGRAGGGTPGFVGGLDAVLGYSFRERLPEIEVPP